MPKLGQDCHPIRTFQGVVFKISKTVPPYSPRSPFHYQHPFHCTISSRTRGRWSGAKFSRNLLASSGPAFGQVHERSQIRRRLQPALLTPSEKDELDEWYVRHACLLLDLRIIMMTLRVLVRGQSRPDGAAANARSPRNLSRGGRAASRAVQRSRNMRCS